MRTINLTISALAIIVISGCASLSQGTSQTLVVNVEPKETICEATRDSSGVIGTVTANNPSLMVSKSKNDIVLTCKATGHKTKVVRLTSSTSANGVIGGAFLDLGIVDMMTGAMWKYGDSVTVALEKE
jgi:hypothetical protein